MGGGGVMRAAGKVAGIGAINGGIRGVPAVPSAEHQVSTAARQATRPVSAILSSSHNDKAGEVTAPVQRPSWEVDDWEFAGGEEELLLNSGDPLPRVVFGGVPTLDEAKAATTELKDALEKVYLNSPDSTGGGRSFSVCQGPSLPLLSNSEYSETKACVTSETTVIPSVPKHALQAFRLLSESPAAQNVAASIACDQNVWNAVMQNSAFTEYVQSHMTAGAASPNTDLNVEESVVDGILEDQKSPKYFEDSSDESEPGNSGTGFMDFLKNIKVKVVDMVSNAGDFIQSIFGGPAAENKSADADASNGPAFMEKTIGASLIGLGVMVIMVVVLKRV